MVLPHQLHKSIHIRVQQTSSKNQQLELVQEKRRPTNCQLESTVNLCVSNLSWSASMPIPIQSQSAADDDLTHVGVCKEIEITIEPKTQVVLTSEVKSFDKSAEKSIQVITSVESSPSTHLQHCSILIEDDVIDDLTGGSVEIIQALESATSLETNAQIMNQQQIRSLFAQGEDDKYSHLLQAEHSALTDRMNELSSFSSISRAVNYSSVSMSAGSSADPTNNLSNYHRHLAISPASTSNESEDELEYSMHSASHSASYSSKPMCAPYQPPQPRMEQGSVSPVSNQQIIRFIEQQNPFRPSPYLSEYKEDDVISIIREPPILLSDVPIAPSLSLACSFAPARSSLRSYPRPKDDGDYEEKVNVPSAPALDWKIRFAADLERSQAIGSDFSGLVDPNEMVLNDVSDESSDDEIRLPVPKNPSIPLGVSQLLDREAANRLIAKQKAKIASARRREELMKKFAKTDADGTTIPAAPAPKPVIPMITCGICQEEIEKSTATVFGGSQADEWISPEARKRGLKCRHGFCRDCIQAFLTHEINDGKVLQIRCPGRQDDNSPCLCIAPSQWIKSFVLRDTYNKYERFVKLKQDDSYRSCPNRACMHVQQHSVGSSNQMTCEKCHQEYCFLHDLAHINSTCADYRKRLKVESKDSVEHIAQNTVRCPWPTCRVTSIKESGCNHMTCSQCSTEYCYLCGGFYFGGLHFSGWNFLGCPNLKSDDLPANSRNTWWRMLFRWTIGFPLLIAALVLGLGLFLVAEAVWLVWFFALLPIWLVWSLYVHCTRKDDYWTQRERTRKIKHVAGWGVYLVGCILD